MVGKGWFPAELGGLDRCYRDLFTRLPQATGVVVGPAARAPDGLMVASERGRFIVRRAAAVWAAAQELARESDVIDVHFALYGVLVSAIGRAARRPLVVHFHGP